jgi:two-component system, OmpR family, response regulator
MEQHLARILNVEDDPFIQAVVRMAIEDVGGMIYEPASSGREGLEKARSFAPDLILLDVMMPGMTGVETLRALRADPQTASIPVIFMTAKVQPHEVSSYLQLGADGVIPKPFDPTTLADEARAIWNHASRSHRSVA